MNAISTKIPAACNVLRTYVLCAAAFLCLAPWPAAQADMAVDIDAGKAVYRFYCYQCHGYAGNAKTLASTYLDPKPRDFTAESRASLPIERMLDAVTNGRPGTAMVNFDSVLTPAEIEAVVWYIRDELLGNPAASEKYHSLENGWENFERYAAAFPFIEGGIALDTPPEDLDDTQRAGRALYTSACVSCHDQPNTNSGEATWEPRAVSFPRRHYSHREGPLDAVSGASPYARHEVPVTPENMNDVEARGMQLYLDNCAFCHAPDGTGKNWIGSFLEPRPRDFTDPAFALRDAPEAFREIVKSGLPNTSMPAWRHVLSDEEIDAIVAYIRLAFRDRGEQQAAQ